jgi:hypothetical protein
VGRTATTARTAIVACLAGAVLASPALAQNSYNVRAEAKVAKPTKVTRTSAVLNGFVQNPTGQKSRLAFTVGRRVMASPWSTSRMPRRVSVRIAGLRPGTRYVVRGQVQAYVLCRGTTRRPCARKFTVRNRPAGTVTFRTKA